MIVGAVVALLALLLVVGLLTGDEGDEASETPARQSGAGAGAEAGLTATRAGQGGGCDPPRYPLAETYLCVENGAGEEILSRRSPRRRRSRRRPLHVNFGNTQVELELNGEELAIEQAANPVGYEFTADGEEELPEGSAPARERSRRHRRHRHRGTEWAGRDRNGPWLADRPAELGVELAHVTICGDRPEDMEAQLRFMADQGSTSSSRAAASARRPTT